ncbi:hypothetical protein E2562_017194 [Oryza meyeriana var. granulata]|uniref:Uncharacterized protein n=1 Tax=Oryza meyeriana var. granulata TaxID=110450 RepID=A0A6G1EL99_9ORYZ|nr:hypothetical protein E2562_017194 [Oryza meyeriana var. granulata]
MANTTSSAHSMGPAGFATQANALLGKNICFQGFLNHELNRPKYQRLTWHPPPTAAPSNCPPRVAAMEHGGQS